MRTAVPADQGEHSPTSARAAQPLGVNTSGGTGGGVGAGEFSDQDFRNDSDRDDLNEVLEDFEVCGIAGV